MTNWLKKNETRLRREQGCLTDCVAYYFNLHPENVPYFVYPRKGWAARLKAFFRRRGIKGKWMKSSWVPSRGTYLVIGDSKVWKTYSHCVVYKNGRLAYDPDYSRAWDDSRITHVFMTEKL